MVLTHEPVLVAELITVLDIKPTGIYVDLTLGRGGHAAAILQRLTTGQLFAFDKDVRAIHEGGAVLSQNRKALTLIHADFKNFKQELLRRDIKAVDGIIADLGVSSPQIDDPHRGFSYQQDGPLDMRMDEASELTAHTIVNEWDEGALVKMLRSNADVMLAQRVAKGIIRQRPIHTTLELVQAIKTSLPAAVLRKKNPAKAVFQAIRIAVNGELEALATLLQEAPSMLSMRGVFAVITFHSIEDRMVKQRFVELVALKTGKLPIIERPQWKVVTKHVSESEAERNHRSRSAKLRALIKIGT